MAEPSYGGFQTYFIVMRQPANACPYNSFTYSSTGQLVQANNIWRISTTMADAVYQTVGAFITANPALECIVIDMDTGEGRYYDGTQAGVAASYWDLRKVACGKVQDYTINEERPTVKDYNIGEVWAQDAKEMQYNVNFSCNKTWIPYRKVTPTRTNPNFNQYGFLGPGILDMASYDNATHLYTLGDYNAEHLDYYVVIFYTRDLTNDTNHIATSEIIPCAKFEKFSIAAKHDDIIRVEMSGHGLTMLTAPRDFANILDYKNP